MLLSGNQADGYTVTADASEFLAREDITYPVMVQPTVNYTTAVGIEDTAIYSGLPTGNFSMYNYYSLGYLNSTYQVGRVLIKFPALFTNSTFSSLQTKHIRRVQLDISTYGNGAEADIVAYSPNGFVWDSTTVTWDSASSVSDTNSLMKFNSATVPANAFSTVSLNITGMVKLSMEENDSHYINEGLYIANSNETSGNCRNFCSSEYGHNINGEYGPIIWVTYNTTENIDVRLMLSYDQTFADRYANGAPGINCYGKMYSIISPSIAYYRDTLGINLLSGNLSTSVYSASYDYCPNLNDYDSFCTCNNTYAGSLFVHHTKASLLHSLVTRGVEDSYIAANFVGQKTCMDCVEGASVCTPSNVKGVTNTGLNCFIVYATGMMDFDQTLVPTVFFHELGHLYGADDHYDTDKPLLPGQNNDCIWGVNKEEQVYGQSWEICDRCKNSIYNNIGKYNH